MILLGLGVRMAFGTRRSDFPAAGSYDDRDDAIVRLADENDDLRRQLADQGASTRPRTTSTARSPRS
jgi:hypothetical protein